MEKQFASLTPEDRLKEREQKSKPVVEAFYVWLGSLREVPKTLLGKAIHYAHSQRAYLVRYLLDGRLEIINNRAENSIRPFVMGRNYVPNIFMCREKRNALQHLVSRIKAST